MNRSPCNYHRRLSSAAVTVVVGLAVTAGVSVSTQGVPPLSFEVVSIKPNTRGFIDLGGGLRLLRGETRCHAADAAAVPGDPLPAAGPGRCAIRNSTVKEMIDVAYDLRFGPIRAVLDQMIIGGPSWTDTEAFDVDAIAGTPSVTLQEMHAMMRTMLAERFGLAFHRETRPFTGLALVLAKGGHKLKTGDPDRKPSFVAAPIVRGQNVPVLTIANVLSQRLGRPVGDKTGLTGLYDFTLSWTPDPTDFGPDGLPVGAGSGNRETGGLMSALQDQLGLRLETQRTVVEAFVIDAVTRLAPN